MSEILAEDNPVYDDSKIVVYKIPKHDSAEPFLLLGSGWHMFDSEFNVRPTMKNSEILIVNPTSSEMDITLNLVLRQYEKKSAMTVSINSEKLGAVDIPTVMTDIHLDNLIIKPGVNVVTLVADEFTTISSTTHLETEDLVDFTDKGSTEFLFSTVSFIVESISITR